MPRKDRPVCVLALKTTVKSLDFPDEMAAALKERFPQVTFHVVPFHPQKIEHLDEAEILYGYTITPALLSSARKLKWLHTVSVRPDTSTLPKNAVSGKILTSPTGGVYSVTIAETILGLMLVFARKIRDSILLQKDERWGAIDIYNSSLPASELNGSTVAIVGLGGRGTAVADRCSAFGMRVIAVVPAKCKKPKSVDEIVLFDDLERALKLADFVIVTCSLTKETEGMLGAKELSLMKKTAILINVASGKIVDENALIDALKNQKIGGAAADAFLTEPLPPNHPFYSAPNMIVMPHVSGWSTRFWERAVDRFAVNLEKYLKGEPLIGVVDFERGY